MTCVPMVGDAWRWSGEGEWRVGLRPPIHPLLMGSYASSSLMKARAEAGLRGTYHVS